MASWQNRDNFGFYEQVAIEKQIEYARLRGMDCCNDLKVIQPTIDKARAILEVGAGYGRVINYLLDHSSATITAVEVSASLVRYLKQRFLRQIDLLHQDIKSLSSSQMFDLILWMCGGICNFSAVEQPHIINFLLRHTKPGGKLVVEIPIKNHEPEYFLSYDETNTRVIKIDGLTLHYHIPSVLDMVVLLDVPTVQSFERIIYQPDKQNYERDIYIIIKSDTK